MRVIAHLLLLPQRHETDARHLDDLEPYTGNIPLGFTLSTETGNQNFVVFIHKVEATIVGDL